MELRDFFKEYPKVALAFSGGADSAYLLYAAKECGADVKAYYVNSAFQPQFEEDDAKRLAEELGVELREVFVDVLKVGESAPLERVEDMVRRILYNRRRGEVVSSYNDSLYNAALVEGLIRIKQ